MNSKVAQINKRHIEENFLACTHINFETTTECNLKCKYCGQSNLYNQERSYKNKYFPIKKAKTFLDSLIRLWNKAGIPNSSIIYIGFYGGEPLLNINFIKEIVSKMKGVRNCLFRLTTNGTLLKKHIEFFVENKIKLDISIDGNKYNNSYRIYKNGKPAFTKTIETIEFIKDKYPEYYKTYVQLHSVLHNRNSMKSIYTYLNKLDKKPSIYSLQELGVNEKRLNDFNFMFKPKNIKQYVGIENEFFKEMPEIQNAITLLYDKKYFYKSTKRLAYKQEFEDDYYIGTCIPFQKSIFISTDCKFYPCEKLSKHFNFGGITEHGFEINYDWILKTYNEYFKKLYNQCKKCFNPKCLACILLLDGEKDKYTCKLYMSEEKYAQKHIELMTLLKKKPQVYQWIANEVHYV